MKFCEKCDNMYYVGLDANDNTKLTYYCRNCGHVDTTLTDEGVCVMDTQMKNGQQQSAHLINKFTKMDPTLPRIRNVRCPNDQCKTNETGHKEPAEIIYIRHDDANLKYIYICSTCDTSWQSR